MIRLRNSSTREKNKNTNMPCAMCKETNTFHTLNFKSSLYIFLKVKVLLSIIEISFCKKSNIFGKLRWPWGVKILLEMALHSFKCFYFPSKVFAFLQFFFALLQIFFIAFLQIYFSFLLSFKYFFAFLQIFFIAFLQI